VAIIDRRTAELAWPGQNAIGKRFADVDIRRLLKKTGGKAVDLRQFDQADYKIWRTIIGVAEAIKTQESVHSNVVCLAYVPLVQTTARTQARMMIRCSGETQSILAAARAQVSAVIEKSKIDKVATFDTIYSEIASGQKRTPVIYLALMSVFAATALLTAAIGILGVVSYSVNRRTAEIGIRVAMGARSRDVRRLLVKSMLPPVFAGITVGLIGSYWATRLFRSLLYQVKPFDPSTIFAASALMLLVALVAALLPARRATRVDPIAALRVE
jgi:predicted lysophospholipase L1 biosynthesis ABC-type transport system permease subunit